MGTKLKLNKTKDLYAFWDNKVTDMINKELASHANKVLINLASNEYFKVIKQRNLNAEVVTPVFKDYKNGEYKTIMTYAKLARGMMISHIVKNKIEKVDGLKDFNTEGYIYNSKLSQGKELVFTRKLN